jgi:hypothetical protein
MLADGLHCALERGMFAIVAPLARKSAGGARGVIRMTGSLAPAARED